jgi:thiamine-phosphate diphosphorylase
LIRKPTDVSTWRLCVIVDAQHLRGRAPADAALAAIAGGADAIQLRDKISPADAFFRAATSVMAVCREAGVPFVVNDRIDIALAADADGAHVGQRDLPAAAARRLLGPGRILGVSASVAGHAITAEAAGADYIGAGPVFDATATKSDAAPPIGPAGLAAICRATKLPAIAIGGINAGNIGAIRAAGASGAAVISAVMSADDIPAAVRDLKRHYSATPSLAATQRM